MAGLILGKRLVTTIDFEDLERVLRHSWHLTLNGQGHYYVCTSGYLDGERFPVQLQNFISGTLKKQDHYNTHPRDNRKCNLRSATAGQNMAGVREVSSNTGIRGVYYTPFGKYRVRISYEGTEGDYGCFDDRETARGVAEQVYQDLWGGFGDRSKAPAIPAILLTPLLLVQVGMEVVE